MVGPNPQTPGTRGLSEAKPALSEAKGRLAEADALRKKKPRAGARGLVVHELKVALPPSEHPINPAQPCRCGVTPLIVTNPLKCAYFASDCVTL